MASNLDPSAVFSELTEWYVKLPLIQKIIFPLLIVGSVSGIIFVSKWANSPDYAVLFSDLSAADSAAVIERLKDQKIKYELRGDGSTIAISPPSIVHEMRISLASEGVPQHGRVGYEIFDEAGLGTTSFQEKIKLIRAKEGELERTIASLQAVRSVRVAITKPDQTVFRGEGNDPTASVLLALSAGGELTKRQVKGIAHLVAGAVERLKPENVTIVDVYGNLLAPNEDEEEGLVAEATRLQYRREVEKGYVKRIEQMLSRVVGPEKVVARVTAEMDFSMNEREEEVFDPGGKVVRSERSVEEGSAAAQRGGVPGVVSNLGEDPSLLAPPGTQPATSKRREDIKNYEVSRAVTKVSAPRGKLIRLSVAVLVDGKYELSEGAKAGDPKVFVPLDQEVLSQIEAIVRSAVGFDAARGDTLTVENIPFFVPEAKFEEQLRSIVTIDTIRDFTYILVPILFLFFVFSYMVKPLVKFLVQPTEAEVDLTRLLPTGISELEQELEVERKRAEVPEYEPSVDLDQLNELIAENAKAVSANPEQAALLIRYWLNDGRV